VAVCTWVNTDIIEVVTSKLADVIKLLSLCFLLFSLCSFAESSDVVAAFGHISDTVLRF